MKIVGRWSKPNKKPYISIQIDNMTAEQFCDTLLYALRTKESRYAKCVARMSKTDKYYKLATHILSRVQDQIDEVESAKYEYFCKTQDKFEKGNI